MHVNKVYMYMIFVVSIYTFLITMGLLIQSSPKQIIFLSHRKGYHKVQILTAVYLNYVICVYDIVYQILKPYNIFVFDSIAFR